MPKAELFGRVDGIEAELREIALKIWGRPEPAFRESFAAGLQAEALEAAGFRLARGIAGMATAFSAEFGSGGPVIGILGEYDSLAGLSQKVAARREPVVEGGLGHGCGHNLLGTGGVGAALALREALASGELRGRVRYYGCPAEETLAGKVFMMRAGAFSDLDACISWHPASMNAVWGCSFLALNSARFKFRGLPAHAAAAPHLGRSALDAVELMNVGANYLREHVPEKARIHYSITNGGGAPNIVPEEAEVWYYLRAPSRAVVEDIYSRLLDIAKGACLMTGTSFRHELEAGCYEILPNEAMGELITRNMLEAGPPRYTEEDRAFARELASTFSPGQKEKIMTTYFAPPEVVAMTLHEGIVKNRDKGEVMAGSVDSGDVSWNVPFAQLTAATWPVGTAAHSWQATASSGSGIGVQAMLFAAKAMAGTVYDLLADGAALARVKAEFAAATAGFRYVSPLPPSLEPPRA